MKLKKNQHYVWKHYLKPWTNNEQICCLRNNKFLFTTNSKNVAVRKFFYESTKLTDIDNKFIEGHLKQYHPSAFQSLNRLISMYDKTTNWDEYLQKCGLEDFHGIVETNFIPLLDKIYKDDLSFLKNTEDLNQFSFFIGCQYMRTNKMKKAILGSLDSFKKTSNVSMPDYYHSLNFQGIADVILLFQSDIIGNWIFSNGYVQIINNCTDINFITGDQPVINVKSDKDEKGIPMGFELYYPISPSKALYIQNKDIKERKVCITEESKIRFLNDKIHNHHQEQIFAKHESDLEQYME
ncbi:MAG: DUF4238 domain-containing protein [Flavobacteriales bacterium]|jgi:hypothetical protein|nr:DUF4238 domain-containing protein [Flavobacteriales bacterium]